MKKLLLPAIIASVFALSACDVEELLNPTADEDVIDQAEADGVLPGTWLADCFSIPEQYQQDGIAGISGTAIFGEDGSLEITQSVFTDTQCQTQDSSTQISGSYSNLVDQSGGRYSFVVNDANNEFIAYVKIVDLDTRIFAFGTPEQLASVADLDILSGSPSALLEWSRSAQ